MKNRIDSSRRNTPWDNKQKITTIEDFAGEKYKENYKNKQPKLKDTNNRINIYFSQTNKKYIPLTTL